MKCSKCGTEFDGKFCPNCGTNAEFSESKVEVNKQQNVKKKEIYKRWWFIALAGILAFIILISLKPLLNNITNKKKWNEIQYTQQLPFPEKAKFEETTSKGDCVEIKIKGSGGNYYNEYKNKCIKKRI